MAKRKKLKLKRDCVLRAFEACAENGLSLGWRRAHKHADKPTPEYLREKMFQAIMELAWETFDFGDLDDE